MLVILYSLFLSETCIFIHPSWIEKISKNLNMNVFFPTSYLDLDLDLHFECKIAWPLLELISTSYLCVWQNSAKSSIYEIFSFVKG